MSKIELDQITSGYNLAKINDNFVKVEDALNKEVLYRKHDIGEPNEMHTTLDMNSNDIINADKISAQKIVTNMLEIGGIPLVPPDTAVDTYAATREALRRSYAESGHTMVNGSFEKGGTVSTVDEVLLYEIQGIAYSWAGTLPKVVPAGSTPESTGGFSPTTWIYAGDELLLNHGVLLGNDGQKYAMSGCAVRRDTALSPDWGPVSDSAHIPINVTSVVGGVDVQVNYVGKKIGSFVAGPDESFARDGTLVGASVASNFANVSLGTPCSFSVDLATSAFEFDTKYFNLIRFGLSIGSNGNISITHPGIRTMLHPIIRYIAPNSNSKILDVHFQTKQTTGITSCYLVGDVEGTISYNGTNWVLGSCDQWVTSDLTFAWNAATGELTVTHPVLLGSPELNLTQLYLGTPLHVSGSAAAGNSFKINFHKFDGTPASLGTGLGAYFSRGKNGIRKTPTGKLLVHLGHVQVNCDHVDYPGGNFWFNSVMQN